jgi:hypothetical protein
MSEHQETDEQRHKTATITAKSMIRTNVATLIGVVTLTIACVTNLISTHQQLTFQAKQIEELTTVTAEMRDALIYNHLLSDGAAAAITSHKLGTYQP